MKARFVSLPLAALAFVSCDKGGPETKPEETNAQERRIEHRTQATAKHDSPGNDKIRAIDRPPSSPFDASLIRPAGTSDQDGNWETLTAEQMIEKFNANGIARMPRSASAEILSTATGAGTPEDQVRFITEQSAAWHQIEKFKNSNGTIPDHIKAALIEDLSKKHGGSLKDMVPELDEQVAASVKVTELRLIGIPGMSPDESQDLIIHAIEKHAPDYKAILSVANQSAK